MHNEMNFTSKEQYTWFNRCTLEILFEFPFIDNLSILFMCKFQYFVFLAYISA